MQVWSVAVSGGAPRLLGDGDDAGDRAGRAIASPSCRNGGSGLRRSTDRSRPSRRSSRAAPATRRRGRPTGARWRSCRTATTTASSASSRDGAADPLSRRRQRRATRCRRGRADGRQIAFVRQPGRGGTPRSPLVQQPQPWSIRIAGDPAQPAPPARRECVEERRRARRFDAAELPAASTCTGPPTIALVFMSYQDGWPHLYSMQHPVQRRRADAAHAGRVHGRARRR